MNEALAQWSAANKYAKPNDVETVMQVLADAGYNTINWQCLTAGYEVYWDKQENKMVLYNSATAELEYPDEYEGNEFTKENKTDERFVQYNHNVKTAL
ncbi:MAG: hypothetical protein J6112_06665, partial [Clostridia bacterium]|nr:hypothetical protein [Clostridia bacterium]